MELALWEGLYRYCDHDGLAVQTGVHGFGRRNGWQSEGAHRSSQLAMFNNLECAVRVVGGGRKERVTRRERALVTFGAPGRSG